MLAYLHSHGLTAWILPDGKLSVRPVENITPEVRDWIREHKAELLRLLIPATDQHGPIEPCHCGCCSFYQAPGATEWVCRICRPVDLAEGYILMVVTEGA